jgi:glycosyl transferase, family 25
MRVPIRAARRWLRILYEVCVLPAQGPDRVISELPPVWVISLARAHDRRVFIRRALDEIGVQFEILDAVDGRELGDRETRSYSELRALREYGRGLARGMLASSISHLRAYQRIVDEGLPECVVIEDDACVSPELVEILHARQFFPRDWEVITFHSMFPWAAPRPIDAGPLPSGFRVCRYARTPLGAQAYLIRQQAARRLLDVGYPVALPPDELLFRPHPAGLKVYGIEPAVVGHASFESEILRVDTPVVVPTRSTWMLRSAMVFAGKCRRRILRRNDNS